MCNFFNDEFILGISITFTLGYICNHICNKLYNYINETSKSICIQNVQNVEEVVIYSKTSICTFKTMEELRQSNYLDDPSLYYDYKEIEEIDFEVIDNNNDNNSLYIALDGARDDDESDDCESDDGESDDGESDDCESDDGDEIQQFQPISLMIHINPKTKLSRLYEKFTIKDYDSNSEEYVLSNISPKCVTLCYNDIKYYIIDILNPLNVNVVGNNILTYTFLYIYMKEVYNVEINKNYKVELETINGINFTLTHGSYITVHRDKYELFPSLEAN